jgi:hypothetical protein
MTDPGVHLKALDTVAGEGMGGYLQWKGTQIKAELAAIKLHRLQRSSVLFKRPNLQTTALLPTSHHFMACRHSYYSDSHKPKIPTCRTPQHFCP